MAKAKGRAKANVAALDSSPSHLLRRAVQLALDAYALEFGPGGLTQRQYAVLAAVAAQQGSTQTDLVRATGIDRSTLADMAARMIAKGLLARERSSVDARANAVHLTAQGREALAAAEPKMAAADAKLLRLISGKNRRETFMRLLKDLVRASEAEAEPGSEKPKKKTKAQKPAKAAKSPKAKKLKKAA